MLPRTTITVDTDVLDAIRDTAIESPGLMQTAFKRRVGRARDKFRNRLRAPTPLPSLPFVWSPDPEANARARRWYFANKVDRRKKGGRYVRTGMLARSVDLVVDYLAASGAAVYVYANDPRIEYVYGNRQVPSHKQSGKPNIDELALEISEELNDNLIEDWHTISDPYAGTRG